MPSISRAASVYFFLCPLLVALLVSLDPEPILPTQNNILNHQCCDGNGLERKEELEDNGDCGIGTPGKQKSVVWRKLVLGKFKVHQCGLALHSFISLKTAGRASIGIYRGSGRTAFDDSSGESLPYTIVPNGYEFSQWV
ncbi:hypothetical protein R3P38DRAFT_2806314 [Favolaschia claudopus]|uniref:Uncharacterized protein n=1 Tax=Favolaschia claudopus TaxID=2862362 RepID=A0AAV9ZKI1_9AGAR